MAAVSLLSKYLIRFRGRHIFNPSNFGLVLGFLLLGSSARSRSSSGGGRRRRGSCFALALIVVGALVVLTRVHLLGVAVLFWLTFAAGLGVLALSGHAMTANWHLGPVSDGYFWQVLILSPEVFVFLCFMITDPKTVPDGRIARRVYAVAIGLIACLLIAPQTTEFGAKVALLGVAHDRLRSPPDAHPARVRAVRFPPRPARGALRGCSCSGSAPDAARRSARAGSRRPRSSPWRSCSPGRPLARTRRRAGPRPAPLSPT